MAGTNQIFRLLSGPITFLVLLALLPIDGKALYMLATMAWMLVWWTLQVVPIGVTALLPMILLPALGIESIKEVSSNYANPIIYLFLGGFILGIAIEKWNLHQRLALVILKRSGTKPRNIIVGFMLATALLSMWISNTAAAMMMLPIGMSLIQLVKPQFENPRHYSNFSVSLLLGLAFAANIGGMATLIGTPPNLVLAALLSESLGIDLGFADWMLFAVPISALIFFTVVIINTRVLFQMPASPLMGLKCVVNERLTALGKPSFGERMVSVVFFCTALLWIFRAPLSNIEILFWLDDTIIALIAAVSLFVLPGEKHSPLLEWKDMRRLPWEILLLFGGGISLASGLSTSGVVGMFGESLAGLSHLHLLLIILIVTAATIFITEVMSNVALVTVFAPLALTLAPILGGSALELAIPLTLAASCAFMLPIATPPNAIVFGSGMIEVKQMMRSGLFLNIICALLIAIYCYKMVPFIFGS